MIFGNIKASILLSLILLLTGCNNSFLGVEQHDRYQPPEGLAGKLYTQTKAEEDLSVFSRALELTGYDKIFDKSGSYTIFAPTDSAFQVFFDTHKEYNSIEDIPVIELTRIVKFLTLQNSWNEEQFRNLSINGWGNSSNDDWTNTFVYKKETILEEEPRKIWMDDESRITDSISSNGTFIVLASDYRKFVPIFTREFFIYNDLDDRDYELYFDRDIEINDDIFVADAKIMGIGIFAANGFIYKIDKVVLPFDNVEEFLEKNDNYSLFLNLWREFTNTTDVDLYKAGNFQPYSEKILPSKDETFSMYNQASIVIPTNNAFIEFIKDYLLPLGGLGGISDDYKRAILSSFFLKEIQPIYNAELEQGFLNSVNMKVNLDPQKIAQKVFASNATIIGYDGFIVPAEYNSIAAPLFLSDDYGLFLKASLLSNATQAMNDKNQNYSFFIVPDKKLVVDSSLYISEDNSKLTTYDVAEDKELQQRSDILKVRILNQIAIGAPRGIASKEFIPNLAGNFIRVERQSDGSYIFSGKEPSTFGYNQRDTLMRINIVPQEITGFDINNGTAYEVDGWFNYEHLPNDNILDRLKNNYPEFFNGLREAGCLSQDERTIVFYNPDIPHTILAPTDASFLQSDFESMNLSDKKNFIKSHFLVGNIIFTDGNNPGGYMMTESGKEIYIDTDIDVLHIMNPGGTIYYSVKENRKNTNVMITTLKPDYTQKEDVGELTSYATTAVLHEIDTVIYPEIVTW